MGREGRPFQIFKFRSMKTGGEGAGLPLTVDGDPRITRAGRFLRRFKLDELPQLFNVVRGDMSLVGPRPEVRKYVNLFEEDYREILTVRPGMTDFASLEFRDENERLQASEDPEGEYLEKILPEKIDLYKKYLRERSLRTDLALIFRTVWTVVAK
jgi:lipopolysaccharide/colanic/teichoic acid biosynthesis glycosyltransferase